MTSQKTVIGKIVSPFGVKGQVKVYPYSDFLHRCYHLKRVIVEGERNAETKWVKDAFVHKNMWVLHFQKCDTHEDALKLKGSFLKIFSSERMSLPEGSYYIDQVLGLEVITTGGKKLGKVYDVLKTGSNDVYVIKEGEKGKEILLPALKSVVNEINREKNYMLVELLPGLED